MYNISVKEAYWTKYQKPLLLGIINTANELCRFSGVARNQETILESAKEVL